MANNPVGTKLRVASPLDQLATGPALLQFEQEHRCEGARPPGTD